jgi:hypothetical protein
MTVAPGTDIGSAAVIVFLKFAVGVIVSPFCLRTSLDQYCEQGLGDRISRSSERVGPVLAWQVPAQSLQELEWRDRR